MMTSDKIRIKKYQQQRVEDWAKAFEIPESKFVEDAINFYLRYLEGKQQLPILASATPKSTTLERVNTSHQAAPEPTVDSEEDDFDGGIDL